MSNRDLVYRVSIHGKSEFARDIAELHGLLRKQATEELALAKAAAAGKRAVKTEEQRHNAAMLRTQFALEKARARNSVREADKAAKDATRAAERAEKEKTKVAKREDAERKRAAEMAGRDSLRRHVEEVRQFERTEREKTRIANRESNARLRDQERVARDMQRQAERDARTQARDRMFDAKRAFRGIGTGIAEGVGGAARMGYSVARGMAGSVVGALGINDAWDVKDIVSERMMAQKLMRSAAIEARAAGGTLGADFNEVEGYAKVRSTALKYGMSQRDLLGAIDAASEKGSGADAVKNIDRIAMQATAMGTDATTVAKMRAQIKMSSKEAGKELNDDKIDTMMAQMHFIGKTGVFRSEDLAKEGESLVSSFVKGGGDLETGWKRYMTFSNAARKATGSGSMARTAIMGIQDAIAKKEGKIGALGIKTRNADDSRRDMMEVIMDVITKTGGQGKQYLDIFDPAKSGKATSILETAFNASGKTMAERKKNGRAAMEKVLAGDDSLNNISVDEMNKDAALRMDDSATRIRKAVESARQSLGDQLAPVIERIAKAAPVWAEKFGALLKWVVDNPYKTAGVVLGAGALKGGSIPMLGAGLRFLGDTLANKLPGFGAKALGGAASALGGTIASAGATPVYIAGAAPGVMGGGAGGIPGMGGLGGAGAGVGGMSGAAMGLIGAAGLATYAIADYAYSNQGKFMQHSKYSTEEYNAGIKEVTDEKTKRNEGMVAMLSGKVDPEDIKKAQVTLETLAPSLAKKLAAGEVNTVEAGAELVNEQANAKPGQFKVGADGQLQTKQLSTEDLQKLLDALSMLAKNAEKASAAMGAMQPPGGTSALKWVPGSKL